MTIILLYNRGKIMFIIYKITNKINNKIYIEKTCRSITIRWQEHCSKANQKDKFYFHNAISKYGKENFIVEEIERTNDENEINFLEQKWIKFYNSNNKNKGYNLTNGGDGLKKYDWNEFRKLWDEGYSIKEIANIYNCDRHTVGERLKEYQNYSYRDSLQRSSYSQKSIDKYDKNKQLIKTYSSIKEAAIDNNCSTAIISNCIKNKTYSAKGYYWNLHGEKLPENIIIKNKRNAVSIQQLDLDGKYIKSFPSAAAAAKEIKPDGNINSISSCILQVCKGKRKTAYGYKWKEDGSIPSR